MNALVLATSLCAVVIANSLHALNIGTSFVALIPFIVLLVWKFRGTGYLAWYIGALAVFAALVQNDKLMYAIAAMCLQLEQVGHHALLSPSTQE